MAGSADKPPIDAILQKVLEAVPFQLIAEGDVEESRRRLRDLPRRPLHEDLRVEDRHIDGPGGPIPIRVYWPGTGVHPVTMFFHGGGFALGDLDTHDVTCRLHAAVAQTVVVAVDYRLAPEHPYPAAVEDVWAATCWVAEHAGEFGADGSRLAVAGDSAGGYLALSLAQRLQEHGETPAAMVAISPLLQLETDPKCAHPNITTDAMFPPKAFDALVALVARAAAGSVVDGEPEDVYEPLDHIEPGLPRTLIHVSGSEVLLHDARLAARRLAAAGVATEVRVWPGQIHDFQLAAPLIPEATRSLRQIGEYIREATG